ncbi:MAG: hypothetical protein R3B70_20605, partial [Polyangiaceae bacterium]
MRKALLLATALLTGTLATSCEERVHGVALTFTNDGGGTRGFVCKEADGDEYLARRAFTEGRAAVV